MFIAAAKEVELGEEPLKMLPASLATMAARLQPAGKVNLSVDVSKDANDHCGPDRLVIECLGNTMDGNLLPYPLRDITGTIAIQGSRIEFADVTARASYKVRGEEVKSVMKMMGGVTLGWDGQQGGDAQIKAGDISLSGQNVRFKSKSLAKVDAVLDYNAQSKEWLSRYFVADFYGGKMTGRLRLSGSADGGLNYLLEAGVAGADMKKFLLDTPVESNPDEHYSSGSIGGSLSIVGSMADDNIRLGRCRLKVVNMEVGKMSPLAKLLTVAKLTQPSDYAFDQMEVDAFIQDNKMFFRQFDLSGKSLAFNGSGWLDLKTDNVDLSLTARGQRLATSSPSIMQSLTEGLGRAVMRVEVKGNAGDPQVITKPLPVIKETLQILGTPARK